jgi:Rrf2 family protein
LRLSRASSYAVTAIVHLVRLGEDTPLASQHIATAEGIPERFLLKVLKPLVDAGILRSVKGPNGGYRLARPASSITLLEIVEAVDGGVRGLAPLLDDSDTVFNRRLDAVCQDVAALVRERLGQVTMSKLAAAK